MKMTFLNKTSSLARLMGSSAVIEHYGKGGNLLKTITEALGKTGLSENITIDQLAPMDEFHIGGLEATKDFVRQLNICETHKVLDIGCGLGGPARFVASCFGSKVTGVDLTPEFVTCGNELTKMVGLSNKVELLTGSALDLDSVLKGERGLYDRAYMLHVGMNIKDKSLLVSQIAAKLRPGGLIGIYDVMKCGKNESEDLDYPVPWTSSKENDFAAYPEDYRNAIELAGLKLIAERNRFDFAVEFFARMSDKKTPPIIGLHLLMNEFPQKMKNMVKNLKLQRISPIEMIAEKP